MKRKNLVLTIALGAVAAMCVIWAGLTLGGVSVTEGIKSIFAPEPEATGISINTGNLTLGVGQKEELEVSLTPGNASSEYVFSSTNEDVAIARGNIISAKKAGSCTIKAKTDNGLSAYCEVTVVAAPKEIDIPSSINMALSESYTLTPGKGDVPDSAFTYKSSDDKIAEADGRGNVIPIKTGSAAITVSTYNKLTAKCEVTVSRTPEKFTLNGGNMRITTGYTTGLECEFEPGCGALTKTFSSSNERIVSVDKEGNITGVRAGNAEITCTLFNGISSQCRVTVYDETERIRKNLDSSKPMVALTFDDGPGGSYTKSILKTLKKYNARGTFFVVGSRIKGGENILRAAYKAGNEIGNHSWDHRYAGDLNIQQQREELKRTNKAIYKVIGDFPTLFRCPGGIPCDIYEKESHMPIIMWSVDTVDWSTKNSNSTFNAIKKVFRKNEDLDGDIVLMHDIQKSTPAAVKKICQYLNKKGYQMVTVSELAYYKGVEMKNGETYGSFYN